MLGRAVEGRAARLGCDLDRPHLVLAAEPAADALERALAGLLPGSLFDRREDSLRGLLRVPAGGERATTEVVRRIHADSAVPLAIGLSSVCVGVASFAEGFEEARQALFGTAVLERETSVVAFEELGAYKYLLRIAADGGVRDATIEAVTRVAEYDRRSRRVASADARGIPQATWEHQRDVRRALYIHPNTLRQRLRRIGDLSGIDLRRDDWLMIEIAVKLVQLRLVLSGR